MAQELACQVQGPEFNTSTEGEKKKKEIKILQEHNQT
jgi:hypothetical protein